MFPLRKAILLPRSSMPLNIFEPRYLALIDHVLAGDRLFGIVQPARTPGDDDEPDSPAGKSAPLRSVGTVGRLTAFSETDDGRYVVSLTGIARFRLGEEIETREPYRTFEVGYDFAHDLVSGHGEDQVDRDHLLVVLKTYLDANELKADWEAIHDSSTEFLVNTLSMISPYGSEEKQALLEAPTLKERAEVLVALAEMEFAARDDGSGSTLQ